MWPRLRRRLCARQISASYMEFTLFMTFSDFLQHFTGNSPQPKLSISWFFWSGLGGTQISALYIQFIFFVEKQQSWISPCYIQFWFFTKKTSLESHRVIYNYTFCDVAETCEKKKSLNNFAYAVPRGPAKRGPQRRIAIRNQWSQGAPAADYPCDADSR